MAGNEAQGAARRTASDAAAAELTPRDHIRLEYLAPPEDLRPLVTTFYLFRCDDAVIHDLQPASVGQLQFFLRGRGLVHYTDGRSERAFADTLQGPYTVAAPFEVEGPIHLFGAALSPLGWGALTGLSAADAVDRQLDAGQVLGPALAPVTADLRALYEADPEMDGAALVPPLADFLRGRVRPVPAGHARLLGQIADWIGSSLNPPVQALYDGSEYSPRQVQRLTAHYCGSSPSQLLRIYRATRVAALLGEPAVSDARVAELTDAFYDQSHMIRELRLFTGRTPVRLLGDDDTVLRALLDVRNFRTVRPTVSPLLPLETGGDDA